MFSFVQNNARPAWSRQAELSPGEAGDFRKLRPSPGLPSATQTEFVTLGRVAPETGFFVVAKQISVIVPSMNLGIRLKALRRQIGLSQEAFGAQGFVSAPGWIKIENGQRMPSEKLIEQITKWLVEDKYMRAGSANTLKEELFTLKYLGSRSPFVREMAKAHARTLPEGEALLVPTPEVKAVRGRPRKHVSDGMALVAETAGVYKTKRNRKPNSGK